MCTPAKLSNLTHYQYFILMSIHIILSCCHWQTFPALRVDGIENEDVSHMTCSTFLLVYKGILYFICCMYRMASMSSIGQRESFPLPAIKEVTEVYRQHFLAYYYDGGLSVCAFIVYCRYANT